MSDLDDRAALRRAEEYLLAGRLADARALFDRCGADGCDHPGAELALARLESLEGRLDSAIARLERLLAAQPALSPARELLADACYRRGDLQQAARAYRGLGRTGFARVLQGFGRARPYTAAGEDGATVAWLRREPLPVIQATVDGQALNLVLDTGAGDLMLDDAVAASLGITPVAEEAAAFAGGLGATVAYGALAALHLGPVVLQTIPVQIMALQALFAPWFPDCPIHGVLGTGLFARTPVALDFRAGRLDLGRAAAVGPRPAVALYLAGTHYPLLQARLSGDQPVLLFLDTGMTGATLGLAASAAGQASLVDTGAAVLGQGGGGAVAGRPVRVAALELDGQSYADLDALVLERFPIERRFGVRIGGLLGHDFFRGRRLVLDFAGGRAAIR